MPSHLFTQNVQTHVQCFETLYRLHFLVWKNFTRFFFGRKTEISGDFFVLKIRRGIGNARRFLSFPNSEISFLCLLLYAHTQLPAGARDLPPRRGCSCHTHITSAFIFARYEQREHHQYLSGNHFPLQRIRLYFSIF